MYDTLSKVKKPPSKKDEKLFVNTSIITKRSFLPFIKGYPQTCVQSWPLPHSCWYPHADIYYSFGEDTNPFTRLEEFEKLRSNTPENYIFQPHFPSPENPFTKRDPYSENDARNKYLETQPVCFVIFGKPGLNTNKLAKMIATSWNCVLISPETQIQEEIKNNSENGQYIANILKSGESLGHEVIIKLIEERINQRDVMHRGYVIEGLPLIPNNPNLNYSSYPDHVNIPEDSNNNSKFTICVCAKHYPSSSSFDFVECESEKGSKVSQDSFDDLIKLKQRIRKCYECDIPRQIEDMFSLWSLKPQIIIYMVCPDLDLLLKRNNFFWNPYSGEVIDKTNEMIEGSQENELDMIEAYQQILKEEYVDESLQKHFVKRLVDMTPNINFQIEIYKRYALPTIDKIILNHNPQNIIRVDGRTSAEKMFEIVSLKLRILPLPRVIVPKKLLESVSFEISGEGIYGEDLTVDRFQNFEGKTKEEVFEKFSYSGAISPRFRWRLSDWKFLCPVELAKGRKVEGDLKNAICFMNCLYFLSSQEAEDSFIENPRPYLLPLNPRPSCKIAIIGPRYSGKTELSNKLAVYLGGTVIDIQRAEDEFIEEQIQDKIAIAMRENLQSVIKDATKILQKEREERESKRLAELKLWSSKIREMLVRLKILKDSQEKSAEISEEIESIRKTLQRYDVHFLEDDEELQTISRDESKIEAYTPDYLKIEEQPVPELTEHDPEVVILLKERIKFLRDKSVKISLQDKVKMIFRNIEIIPPILVGEITRDGGWILDNMYMDPEIWKGLIESGLVINDVIVLYEEEPYDYLINNWNRLNDYGEDDYEYNDEPLNMEIGLIDLNKEDEKNYPKTTEIKTLSEYIKTIKEFEKNLKNFQDKLKELGKEVLFCNLKEIDLFEFVSRYFNKEYHLVASKMTEKEKEMESRDFGDFRSKFLDNLEEEEEDTIEEEEEEDADNESTASPEVSKSDNRRLGDTSHYCPVALMQHGVFWKGQKDLSALLANKIYLFSNEKALEEFIKNSNKFSLPFKEPLCKIPPLRLCIVGPPGSGKSTIARAISKECGLAHIDYFDKINDYMLQLGFKLVNWKQEDSFNAKNKEIPDEDDEDDLEHLNTDDEQSDDQKTNDLASEDPRTDLKSENLSPAQEIYVIDKDVTESTVRNYRKKGGNLPDAMLKETLFKYFKYPFDKCGVIFDSFPNCTQDVELMLNKYAVPEIIIELKCSFDQAQKRLLPTLLASWKAKQDQRKLEEQRRFDMELEEFNERKEKWIREKLKERKRRRRVDRFEEEEFDDFNEDNSIRTPPPSPASGSESEILLFEKATTIIESQKFSLDSEHNPYSQQTTADRVKLEKLYLKNNAEPKIFSDWDKEGSAKKRIIRKMKEAYRSSTQNLRRTRDRMKKESIPWFEINSQTEVVQLFCNLLTLLDPYLHKNSSVLERTYEINIEIVEELLDSGYYFLSSFGRYCPVQMYERKISFHMFLPLEAQGQIFPLLHRQYIYFFSGREALESFKKDPLKYLNQDSCSPLIPVQISIIGPPKCGKTTLAQRFARTYGFKLITRGQSLRNTQEKFSWTDLAFSIENNLREGNVVADEQVAHAVDSYLLDPRSSLGFILDGFPVSQLEAEELALLAIKPMIILDLEANLDFCLECLLSDAEEIKKPSIISPEFLTHQYEAWQVGEKEFRDWLSGFAANIVKIDATRNKWGVWTRADEMVRSRFTAIKKYFREADYDRVHHLEHLSVSPYEFRKRESIYQTCCPVCIQLNIFKSSPIPLDRKGVFQFRDHFYWVCLNHVDTFVNNPLENIKKEMPADCPQILEETIDIEHSCWEKRLKSGGYCLVTYVESLPYRKLVAGKLDLALLYKDRLYLFCTIECRNRFMARSSDYSEVEIHFQKTLPPIQVKNLPNLGFLEQTVASLIIKAVNYLGVLRPKLLGLSASTTAAIYLGSYLKIHNLTCELNEVAIYEEVLKRMKARSKFLRIVIRNMKNKVNPYVTLIPEEWKKILEIKSLKNESLEENLENVLSKSTENVSRTSQLSRQSSTVRFRRTSPTQILTDTESLISSSSST